MRRLLAAALLLLIGVSPVAAQTYTLAPLGYQTMLDANGDPIADGCVWTYTAGTSTPVTTYRSASGTANANPVEADSAGRYAIYLAPGSTYKFIYESDCAPPTHGAVIRTVDNISAVALGSAQTDDLGPCEGRMTLTSGTPITTTDVTAATTMYFTPYKGNVCPIYDPVTGSWSLISFSESSLSLGTDTASLPYDLFAYSNAGVFTLERLAWTSDTARATALTLQNGVYVKSGQLSRRYLGTYRTTTVIGQTEDSMVRRYVWNYYNRVRRVLARLDSTDSYTYDTATYRQMHADAANQVDVVVGLAGEALLSLDLIGLASHSAAGMLPSVAIGQNSTTTPTTGPTAPQLIVTVATPVALYIVGPRAHLDLYPAIGRSFFAALEQGVGATTTFYGDNGTPTRFQAGLSGWIEG